jgi:hypothetical protein
MPKAGIHLHPNQNIKVNIFAYIVKKKVSVPLFSAKKSKLSRLLPEFLRLLDRGAFSLPTDPRKHFLIRIT